MRGLPALCKIGASLRHEKLLVLAAAALILSTLYVLSRSAPSPGLRNTSADVSALIPSGATPEVLADILSYEYTQTYVYSIYPPPIHFV